MTKKGKRSPGNQDYIQLILYLKRVHEFSHEEWKNLGLQKDEVVKRYGHAGHAEEDQYFRPAGYRTGMLPGFQSVFNPVVGSYGPEKKGHAIMVRNPGAEDLSGKDDQGKQREGNMNARLYIPLENRFYRVHETKVANADPPGISQQNLSRWNRVRKAMESGN